MWNSLVGESISLDDEKLLDWLGIEPDTPRYAIGEVTYFTCLKMLSETMGKMPLKFYKQTDKMPGILHIHLEQRSLSGSLYSKF